MTCDCCGLSEVDEVALLVICEGIVGFRDALTARIERDQEAWAVAHAEIDQALAAARRELGG